MENNLRRVPRLEKNGVAQPNEVIDAERPAERGICHQFWPLIARNQRSSQAPAGRRESPANNLTKQKNEH
jgi:hypothetical protein